MTTDGTRDQQVDVSRDEVARELRDTAAVQRDSLGKLEEGMLTALAPTGGAPADPDVRGRLFAGLTRRRFVSMGGFAVATSAVLAACMKKTTSEVAKVGEPGTAATVPAQVITDEVLLRTASSLEHVAVDAYQMAIDSGLVTDRAVVNAAKLFQSQHAEHAKMIEALTNQLGGEAYTKANPIVMANVVNPAKEKLKDSTSVISFAYQLETIAAQTYQALVPALNASRLRVAAMSVGGVEARHAALLARFLPTYVVTAGLENYVSTTTTTAAPAAEGATAAVVETVYAVPATFQGVGSALGPNSFIYTD